MNRKDTMTAYNLARSAQRAAEEKALFVLAEYATECVDWPWGVNTHGYGQLGDSKKKSRLAHRASYEHAHGPIPDNVQVLHMCDRPLCITPLHLYLGDVNANMDDRHTRKRDAVGFRNGGAKLTEELVREIRASSLNDSACARLYGVGHTCINNIRKRHTWKHVP